MNETPSAFSISQDEIDHILRVGSNSENARMKIVTAFSLHAMDYADILKSMYHGGYGIETGAGTLSAWYAEDGIHLSRGNAAEYAADAQVISWVDAARRVSELLDQGRFATNVEIAEAPGLERLELAHSLLYLTGDLTEAAQARGYLPAFRTINGRPSDVAADQLAQLLSIPDRRDPLIEEYRQFMIAWRDEPDLLRFSRFRQPASLMNRLNELKLPRHEYLSDMTELPEVRHRITEDEINHVFTDAGADRKQAVYAFWQQGHTPKEKEKFLRDLYGIGGYNGALSRNFYSWLDHESKGMRFRKQDCGTVELRWAKIVRRLDDLIANGRYLSQAELEKYESDRLAQPVDQEQPEQKPERIPEQAEPIEPESVESVTESPAESDEAGEIVSENAVPEPTTRTNTAPHLSDYAALKLAHDDDIVLYQAGDFYEIYGYEAKLAAETLDLAYTMRMVPGLGQVYMCGFPVANLEQNLERLREKADVIVSGISSQTGERVVVSFPSVDHEAEQALNAREAEFGADGTRVFRDPAAQQETPPAPPKREIIQEDIDRAIQAWNGSLQSKHAVARHMEVYARDRKTAEWKAICQGFFYLSFHPTFSARKMAFGAGAW